MFSANAASSVSGSISVIQTNRLESGPLANTRSDALSGTAQPAVVGGSINLSGFTSRLHCGDAMTLHSLRKSKPSRYSIGIEMRPNALIFLALILQGARRRSQNCLESRRACKMESAT